MTIDQLTILPYPNQRKEIKNYIIIFNKQHIQKKMHAGVISRNLARVKPVEGVPGGPKTPVLPSKGIKQKTDKISSSTTSKQQQQQPINTQLTKQSTKQNQQNKSNNGKKQHKHQTYDLIVNIDLRECGLTEDQVAEFKEAFMLFDKDEDGIVSIQELGVILQCLGQRPTAIELETMVGGLDGDGNGGIEFNDFLQAMGKKQREEETEEGLKEAFRVFDKKGDGSISCVELRRVLTSMGEKLSIEEADEMLREADVEKRGIVNYVHFVSLLTAKN